MFEAIINSCIAMSLEVHAQNYKAKRDMAKKEEEESIASGGA